MSLLQHGLSHHYCIGVVGMSDIDESLTTEQSRELIRLCRTGRLHDVQKWIADGRSPPDSFRIKEKAASNCCLGWISQLGGADRNAREQPVIEECGVSHRSFDA
jgi:hypothetical protein